MPLTTNNTPSRRLYRLVFPDGRAYVGITKLAGNRRFNLHKSKSKTESARLYVTWREVGTPTFEVLAVVAEHMWVETERRAIEVLRPELNTDPGGTGKGRPFSPETRAKMSAAALGVKKKPRAASHCAALSVALTGKKASAEAIAKMRAAKLGRKHTAEHNAKISAAHRSRKCR